MRKIKLWKIISLFILLVVSIFVIWLFQTNSPTEKVYTADGQYSYYLEEYNYNKILEGRLPFYTTEYRLFLYDETNHKKLLSRYLGEHPIKQDYFGFDYEDNRLYFEKGDWYNLTRPVDQKAIEKRQQEKRKEQLKMEDERTEQKIREFQNLPLILEDDIEMIKPILKKWIDFYGVDLAQTRFVSKDSVCLADTSPIKIYIPDSIYHREYAPKQNTSERIEMFYSPNKQYYVDIGILCENINGKYYDNGDYDDSQAIYFTNRPLRQNHLLFYFGISTGIESVFWKNNDVFILVGKDFGEPAITNLFFYEYNIPNQTRTHYSTLVPSCNDKNYRMEVVMKEKGIIVNY